MSEGLEEFSIPASDVEDADEAAESKFVFPSPSLDDCPVIPLGFTGPRVVFAMPEGEMRVELASKIASMLRTDIFACQAGGAFLAHWRDRDEKFMRDLAAIWFVRKCREAGPWDSNRAIRSLGVWPTRGGRVVLHRGVQLRVYEPGKDVTAWSIAQGLRVTSSGPLYRLAPQAPAPADEPADAGVGAKARAHLDHWRFEPIGEDGLTGADVALGWVGGAMLGAVAPFRGHLMLYALAGSGKTSLIEFLHALMSALCGEVIDSFTDAGLRNDLAGMARPVMIDEAEATPGLNGPGPVERALELLRRMATGSGGTRKQGDIGGGAVTQTAVGAVLLAAVNPPRLGPADATRMVEVRLKPLSTPGPKVDAAGLASACAWAAEVAPAVLARALGSAGRYRADVERMKAAFALTGQTPRAADLIAFLAAGRRMLLSDEPLTEAEAADEARFWTPLLEQRAEAEVVSNTGSDALAHLMNADSGKHMSDRRVTLGELVQMLLDDPASTAADVLKAHGLKIYREAWEDGSPGPWLLVANHHPALEAIFGRTAWRDWRRALAFLDAMGAEHQTRAAKPQKFGVGIVQRALAIPLAPWLRTVTSVTATVTGQADEF